MDGITSRMQETKEWISELKRRIEIPHFEQ